MACSTFFTLQTTFTCRRLMSSSDAGYIVSCGQHSSGSCTNSCSLLHLPFRSSTRIPLETSSATFTSPEMWLHWFGPVLAWTSPTREETDGLMLRDMLCSQARVIALLVKSSMDWSCILASNCTVLAKQDARTAAYNFNRGILSCFKGATRDFAATNLTWYLSSFVL